MGWLTKVRSTVSRYIRNKRLAAKLLVSYLLVAMIPLVFWSISSFQSANQRVSEQAQAYLSSTIESTLLNINSALSQVESSVQMIAGNQLVAGIVTTEELNSYDQYYNVTYQLDPMLFNFLSYTPAATKARFYTNGSIQGSRQSFLPLNELDDQSFLQAEQAARECRWRMREGQLSLLYKVYNLRTSRYAVMEVLLDPEIFFAASLSDRPSVFDCCVSSSTGDVFYGNVGLLAGETDKQTGFLQESRPLKNPDWTLTLVMDTGPHILSSRNLFAYTAFLIVFSLGLILLVTRVLTISITGRIQNLCRQLGAVVQNRFRTEITSEDKDEIGMIVNSAGLMVRETRHLVEEVYESKIQQREAEIKALQAQINPHFLYNTLSAINWMALRNGNDDISRMVTNMSSFYRTVLNQGSSVTTVKNELDNIKAYVEIQLTLRSNSFDMEYHIEPSVLEYEMPNLILQPVVENAIEHGLRKKMKRRGKISLSAAAEGEGIVFKISDNGVGMSSQVLSQILESSSKKGYGISNVNNRLRLFFGEGYGIRFDSTVGHGTVARIHIPKYVQQLHSSDEAASQQNERGSAAPEEGDNHVLST